MGANQFLPIPLPNPALQAFVDPNLVTIVDVTNANPAVYETAVPHGYANGDTVVVKGVLGMGDEPNKITDILVVDATHFSGSLVNTSLTGAYVGGGQVTKSGKRYVGTVTPGTPVMIETLNAPAALGGVPVPHNITTGEAIEIKDSTIYPELNGIWVVTVISATEFTLDGSSVLAPPGPGDGTIDLNTYPVACDTGLPHGYSDGSLVEVFLDSSSPGTVFEIDVLSPTQFALQFDGEDIQYPSGGIVRQVATGPVDLAAEVPPNGVEKRKTFSIAGDYSGRIILEGSMDADKFAPFLLFNEGKPGGIKVIEVNVPFIRARGEGLIINSGTLVGFMAAEENCDCDTSGPCHGANAYDNLDVPDPSELPFDREALVPIATATDDGGGLVQITTETEHPYITGDDVRIEDVVDSFHTPLPSVNGVWTITVIDQFNFTLDGSVYVADGTGGTSRIITAPNTSPIPLRTEFPHGYQTGDFVRVRNVVGNSGANGDFFITVTGPNTFTLDGSLATGDGTGGTVQALSSAGTNTSGYKSEKTLQLQGGPYTGAFVIEATLDPNPGPIFLPFTKFDTGGADEKLELDALFFAMRVAPVGASGDVDIFIGTQLTCPCLIVEPPPLVPELAPVGFDKLKSSTPGSAPKTSAKSPAPSSRGKKPGQDNKAAAKRAERDGRVKARTNKKTPKSDKAIAKKKGARS